MSSALAIVSKAVFETQAAGAGPRTVLPLDDDGSTHAALAGLADGGTGIQARPGTLGMSLQTPRTLTDSYVALLRSATGKPAKGSRVVAPDTSTHLASPYRGFKLPYFSPGTRQHVVRL